MPMQSVQIKKGTVDSDADSKTGRSSKERKREFA